MSVKSDWQDGEELFAADFNVVADAVNANTDFIADIETDKVPEGTGNLYYTPGRVDARIATAIASLIGAAPPELDTWIELVSAIQNNHDALAGIAASLSGKQPISNDLTTFVTLLTGLTGSGARMLTYAGDTDAWAAIATQAFGRSLLDTADPAAVRQLIELGTLATKSFPGAPDGTKFLRDDGTFATPVGGGGGTGATISAYTTDSGGANNIDVPTGAKAVIVTAIGAGGGGGSGAYAGGTANRCGGGGGAGGNVVVGRLVPATALGTKINVTVGARGLGAPAVTGGAANGTAGTAGGDAVFTSGPTTVTASGGGGGAGGAGSAAAGGTPGPWGDRPGTAGGAGYTQTETSPAANSGVAAGGAAGGGGGAGATSSGGNSVKAGNGGSTVDGTGGVGATQGGAGSGGGQGTAAIAARPGAGAGGGAISNTATNQAGGSALGYGGGGGGGGGGYTSTGNGSGAGGNGGPAYVCLLWIF